jgi:hypothetical protein
MKPRKINFLWVGAGLSTLLISVLLAYTLPFFDRLNPSSSSKSPTASPSPSGAANVTTQGSKQFQPESRVIPLSIEGQSVEVELRLFNPAGVSFTTYVPAKDFQSDVSGSGEGQGIRFYFSPTGKKDKNAYVQMFMPSSPNSVEDIRQLILGDQGVMASNQWELVDRTDIISYPWAKEKLTYQQQTQGTAGEMIIGSIYIGEDKGKAFYILTHYPAEYSDGFEPRSAVILENLQFRE